MKKQPTANLATSRVREKKGKRPQEGDFVQIKLDDSLYAYGRVLESPTLAFYDIIGEPLEDLNVLLKSPVLFKIWVMKDAFKKPNWQLVAVTNSKKNSQDASGSSRKTAFLES